MTEHKEIQVDRETDAESPCPELAEYIPQQCSVNRISACLELIVANPNIGMLFAYNLAIFFRY